MANQDLTVGKPLQILLRFSLPMLLSMALQQFYSIADSIIIGKCLGDEAFAAVSVSYPVTVLFVAFASGSSIGVSVVMSQLFGERRNAAVRTCAYTAVTAMTVAGVVLSAVGIVLCCPLLTWMNTDGAIFADAATYLSIYATGVLFLCWYNTANGAFTALGDSLTPLWLLVLSSVLNVVLDMVFVGVCGLGVAGAALATLIAQGISSLTAGVLLLRRLQNLPDSRGFSLMSGLYLKRIVHIAVPSVCQQAFVSVGQLFVQGSINTFPVAVQSGYGGAFKINTFTISCISTLSNALSSYTAQNMGAQKWRRIRDGRAVALKLACGFAAVIGVLIAVFSGALMSLFTSDTEIRKIGQQFLWTVAPFYGIIAIKIINDGVFRGTGAMRQFMLSTALDLALRVIASHVLPHWIGYQGIWWAYPIGWTACTLLSMISYRYFRRVHNVGMYT